MLTAAVAAVSLTLTAGLVSCQHPSPEAGKVIERIARPAGGVDLRVEHDNHNVRLHGYTTPQAKCVVGARWPDCIRDNQ